MDYQMDSSASGDTPRTFVDPRLNYNAAQMPVETPKHMEITSQEFVDKWLLDKGKFQMPQLPYIPTRKKPELTISGTRKSLKQCLDLVEKLEKTQEELRENVATMSSVEWKQKTLEMGNLRDDFNKYMLAFETNNNLAALLKMTKKRARKRLNQKRSKEFRRQQLQLQQEERKEAHQKIDLWLEQKKDEMERAKMEERMKKDADCVMYEVTKNKSEARKHLSLISALVKLRTVRDAMATQRGDKLSLEDRQAFGSVTEKLIRMWENAFQDYSKEEECLQVMLEHNATKDCEAIKIAKEQHVVNQWELVVFGPMLRTPPSPIYWALLSAERDMETFIAIRKSWDTFVTSQTNPAGSSIPIGWVIPPPEPTPQWSNYLG